MKKLILFALIIFSANIVYGQDLIIKSTGDSVYCKILSQDSNKINISFMKDNQAIKTYIPISGVSKILPAYYTNTGHYLKSASNCMWGQMLTAMASGALFYFGAKNNNTTLYVASGAFGIASLFCTIAIPIQLNNAGKSYIREKKK